MPKKKESKHPKDMTTAEALKHLFTPKGAKHIAKHIAKLERKKLTKKS